MPDPIQGVNPTQPPDVQSAGQAPAAPASGGSTQQPTPAAVDSADVAQAEALLATIASAAKTVPAVDQSRVAQLQQAVLSGDYRVDPQQIVQKILELEQLLATGGR